MIRSNKQLPFDGYLEPVDRALLAQPVDEDGWYPMETFERLGIAIVQEVARGQLPAVRMWGRFQVQQIVRAHPTLVAARDARETLMRFQALRRAFFDYDAIVVAEVLDDEATIEIAYSMGAKAEEAACHQTLGFFEHLVELAGATKVSARFTAEGWNARPPTRVLVRWQ